MRSELNPSEFVPKVGNLMQYRSGTDHVVVLLLENVEGSIYRCVCLYTSPDTCWKLMEIYDRFDAGIACPDWTLYDGSITLRN